MEIVSRVHAKNLVQWAEKKEDVVVLSADLTSSTEIDLFREHYPSRFFSMGIAEQNMLSVASGMAREGFVPFIHTFAVFIYRRALDQIAMSVAYPNVNVKMFGFLPGIMTPGGASHQAIEDIAIMRAIPNMTIFETGDATDVESILDLVYEVKGPVYVRMLRGDIPRLFPAHEKTIFQQSRELSKGSDLVIASSGICTEEAMRVVHLLKEKGVSVGHYHVTTLKPFHDERLMQAIAESKHGVISYENHTIMGGLGTILAEEMAERGIGKKLKRMGLKDTFSQGASKDYLMKKHGLSAYSLLGEIEKMLKTSFFISEDALKSVPFHLPTSNVEDL